MKVLVWSDVHHRIDLLNRFLEKRGQEFEKRIFLGDWFDQWRDHPDHAKKTAQYLVELMEDEKNVFIEGNHDTSYRFRNPVSFCSGYSEDKARFIHSVMSRAHWNKFKLFHIEQGIWCSHAGIHPSVFEHPILGITEETVQKECDKAVECARANIKHPVYSCGMSSGGTHPFGGINWIRWSALSPIEGINQIVGHTEVNQPEISYARKRISRKHKDGKIEEKIHIQNVTVTLEQYLDWPPKEDSIVSRNWNIDTNNNHFAIIEDGKVTIHETAKYL